MRKKLSVIVLAVLLLFFFAAQNRTKVMIMRPELVRLDTIDATIQQSPRYAGDENFLGAPVPGYLKPVIYCTPQAALALKQVNAALQAKGYQLVVYDGYRPQRAVDAFIAWSTSTGQDTKQADYYPTIAKAHLFELGYLAKQSGHSRGSTVDLTMIPLHELVKPVVKSHRMLNNGESIPFLDDNTVNMGSSFDLFHPVSQATSSLITPEQAKRRQLLRQTMEAHGFKGIPEEWWHYTLVNEPYPNDYFDVIPEEYKARECLKKGI